ncbi:3-phosphoshikimate 1-carboxyvinyltransferase [Anoxybacillus ayderensis]|uniref:3-phosphoshikimate 1-carboxyvinyltransferase n=1 Tax=Anoxybacillus ayderensis TaxID=265546 RepID=UPI002E24A039|nr:3-phosphoshikimate 1-carboxyvinyltransferase [Anoxybacillus ayderensis]MED0687363.1 3-phosphoshikimate 1-carboxyvinyltransferase [Anoxybacillus ayderensis]
MNLKTNVHALRGEIAVPGDKSISHRAVMFGALANGTTRVTNFLTGEDCLSTIDCFRKMGVAITQQGNEVIIEGKGIDGLKEPTHILNVGNSGTTTRLLLGILAACPFHACLIGDDSIAKRPMDRVTKPLKQMGAHIDGREQGRYTPLAIRGGQLQPITYHSPVASAQVKSAILLAGLHADGTTTVIEPHQSRDHTERMLRAFGADVRVDGLSVSITGRQTLRAIDIEVPGDISSAAFFLVAGAIVPNSEITLKHVGINPTRTGIIDVLKDMGADVSIENVRHEESEPVADITVRTSTLKATRIGGDIIPRLIDEIPIIALLATQAEGTTVITDANELKVKETDRIATVVSELRKLGAHIEATEDGMIIHGKTPLHANDVLVDSYGDHRIGMMLAIASCITKGHVTLQRPEAIAVSYPTFFDHLRILQS